MTLQEQMIKAMDEADRVSNKPFKREDAANVCAEIAELYARSKATKAWYAGYSTLDPDVPSKVFDEFMEKEFKA